MLVIGQHAEGKGRDEKGLEKSGIYMVVKRGEDMKWNGIGTSSAESKGKR